jgi:YgiT-type zinc finger domain-containing protein
MGNTLQERFPVKCTIRGCTGEYEIRHILHTFQEGEQVYVFENVSAEVCDVCSDTLLAPDTIKSMEQRLRQKKQPSRMVPVLDYA